MLKIKRIYEKPSPDDGIKILVDRLWPRGINKKTANITVWLEDIAPSDSLRKWFGHRPERWEEFKSRYLDELKEKKNIITQLRKLAQKERATLIYSAKNENNNAKVLFELITKRM